MGLLIRLGHDADVLELEVLALMREALLLGEDLERLEESVPALAVRDVETLIVPGKSAPAHAELEPPLGEMVDRRDVLGQAQRVAQREHLDRDADLDAPGARRQRRCDHQRRRKYRSILLEMDLGEPDGVEAHVLRRLHLAQRIVEGRRLAHPRRARELREQAEFHPTLPLKFEISYA
jgi:hypothetical protein